VSIEPIRFPFPSLAPLGTGVGVVQSDGAGLVALSKPAGILSHPNKRGEEGRSLLNASYSVDGEFYAWETPDGLRHRAWLLNRLDSATSGVVLLATDEELARTIRLLFKTKQVRKYYVALVFGRPIGKRDVWQDRVAVQKSAGQIRTATGGNVPAESVMQLLKTSQIAGAPRSLIQLEPRTGRSHQLRVQCAQRHLPIIGDATYGDFRLNRAFAKSTGAKRLFLHSAHTAFDYEWKGKRWHFSADAPIPPEFLAVFARHA
jgi:tRNA pseudouridine65 synthase